MARPRDGPAGRGGEGRAATVGLDADGKRRSARCTLTHSYVLLPVAFSDGVEDDAHLGPDLTGGGVFLFGMQRGALPAAQAWNTMLSDRKNPGFTVVYDLAVSKRSGPGGAIYTPVARPVHRIFDPRALEALEGYRHEAFEQQEAILTYLTRSDSVPEPESAPVDVTPMGGGRRRLLTFGGPGGRQPPPGPPPFPLLDGCPRTRPPWKEVPSVETRAFFDRLLGAAAAGWRSAWCRKARGG